MEIVHKTKTQQQMLKRIVLGWLAWKHHSQVWMGREAQTTVSVSVSSLCVQLPSCWLQYQCCQSW